MTINPLFQKIWRWMDRHPAWSIFFLNLILTIPVWILVALDSSRELQVGDPPGYRALAYNLLSYGVFSVKAVAPFLPDAFRTPGYPLFLAAIFGITGRSLFAAAVAQGIVHALSGVMVFYLTEDFLQNRKAAWIAGILWAVSPVPLMFSGILFTETLFTLLLLLTIWLVRKKTALAIAVAGFLLGFSILVRPIAVLLIPVLVPAVWSVSRGKNSIGKILLFCATSSVMLLPWMFRNQIVFGRFSLASVGGNNLLQYNASSCIGWQTGLGWEKGKQQAKGEYDKYVASLPVPPANAIEEADAMSAVAIRILLENPVACAFYNGVDSLNSFRPGVSYFILFLDPKMISADTMSSGELSPAMQGIANPSIFFLTIILTAFYGAMYGFALLGLGFLPRENRWAFLWFWILPIGLLLYAPGLAGNARFRIPSEPALCLLGAAAINFGIPSILASLNRIFLRRKTPAK